MKKMGISVKEVPDVVKVTIETEGEVIEINEPQVLEISGKVGEAGFQVLGGTVARKSKEESAQAAVPEEDVEFVASQAGTSKEAAREALIRADGDIAQALLLLKHRKRKKGLHLRGGAVG